MKRVASSAPAGQLDFFAMFDAVDKVIEVATATVPTKHLVPHPAGSYLIYSDSEQGFWSNDAGWVANRESATPFSPEHVCPAQLTQWRRDGQEIVGARNHWHWVARPGGLAGYRGADFDGPFASEQAALQAALDTIGPGKPLMTTSDAEYVLATASVGH